MTSWDCRRVERPGRLWSGSFCEFVLGFAPLPLVVAEAWLLVFG